MAVNIKNIFFFILVLPIYLYSIDTYTNKDIVLKELQENVNDSKIILSEKIGSCLDSGNSNLIKLTNENILKKYKKIHILNFLKYKYHHNFDNCLNHHEEIYIYNLAKLYHAQKQYNIETTNTLIEIDKYFEPIEAIDKRMEYKSYPDSLKNYLNNLVGEKPFNIFEISKDISNFYN